MAILIKNSVKLLIALCLTTLLVACGGGTDSNSLLSSVTAVSSGSSAAPATSTATGAVTLSWMPPTENTDGSALTDLSGYNIYYGSSPDSLTNTIALDSAGLTSYVVEGLAADTVYYFAITALNSNDVQSNLSNIATKNVSS